MTLKKITTSNSQFDSILFWEDNSETPLSSQCLNPSYFEIIRVSHYSIDILDFNEVVFYDAPYRAIRMKKIPAINTIFEKVKYKEYEKNALLKQDILSYYYEVIKGEKVDNLFRFRDL